MRIKVTIVVFAPLPLFELACATELFALPRPEFDHWYDCQVVSFDAAQHQALAAMSLGCRQVEQLPPTDVLVIPGFPVARTTLPQGLRDGIDDCLNKGGRILSFCSGAFCLAELGLLTGRQATTHWQYAELFIRRYPGVDYRADVLYTYDGQIGCSAGSAAAIDLGIEVIRRDFGMSSANAVARRLVLPAHRSGGQSQFVEKPLAIKASRLSDTLQWAVQNLCNTLTIGDLAAKASMSRRTFDRHFRACYGISPMTWLIERKIEVAKGLLETTDLPLERIADMAGFDNPITMRHHFNRVLSVTPSRYKALFAATPRTK